MRRLLLIFSIIAGLCLFSCRQKEQRQETIHKKEILLSESQSSADKFFHSLTERKYIQLETTEECMFTEITQLFCTEKELFIFDIYTQSIYTFDYNGRFLRKLHKTGTGPGEYAMIGSISINEKSGRIGVVNVGDNILFYDMHSFRFLGEQKINAVSIEEDILGNIFAYNSLSTIVDGKRYKYHIITYDKNGKIKKAFLPISFESGYTMRPIYRFYKENNKLFIYLPFSAEIYQLEDDNCSDVYTIKLGNHIFPSSEYLKRYQKTNENYIQDLYSRQYIYSVQLFSNDLFLSIQFQIGSKRYIGFYNKNTETGEYYFLKDIYETSSSIDYFQPVGSYQNYFISSLKPADVLKVGDKADEDLQKIASNLSEESNPILFFFKR